MLKNYLKITLRYLLKFKIYSLINIVGLAIGLTACIFILLFVKDELSFDRFNKHADQIYRIYLKGLINNQELNSALSPAPVGPALKRDLAEVTSYTRIKNFGVPVVRYQDKIFDEKNFFLVDSTFFNVFTVRFIEGDSKTALTQPNTVVITSQIAKKYFGKNKAIGKILNLDNNNDYIVTGVVENFPYDSHFHFDFLGSLTTYNDSRNPFWLSFTYYTYIRLKDGTNPAKFQRELNQEFRKYGSPQLKQSMGISLEQFEAAGNRFGLLIQPLTSIHLFSNLDIELESNGDISYVYIFSIIAFAILLIACINFINLSTARSEKRAKEVGIRKTLGSKKSQLVRQFISESILLCILAIIIAIVLVEILLPVFNNITGKEMDFKLFSDISTIPFLICLAVFVGFAAGCYPAFFLSSYEPIQVIKSYTMRGIRKTFLRNGLVIFQFAISIILFIGTFIIYEQLKFIQNKNLGFNKEHLVIINKADKIGNHIEPFKQELLQNSKVITVSNSTAVPGDQKGAAAFWIEGKSSQQAQGIRFMLSDYDFLKTYHLRLTEGRYLSKDYPSDTNAVVLNQAAVRAIGVNKILGKYLVSPGASLSSAKKYKIIGVINDFNFSSLHEIVQPLIIGLLPSNRTGNFLSVRITSNDYAASISLLENIWKKYAKGETFDYNFLDRNLANLYVAEQRTSKLATAFSVLGIFIACLGLLGLAAFIIEQRAKEIGIRKVVGATVPEIIIMLSKEFTKWVLVANILAWPVAYYFMNKWLQNFAYHTNMNLWMFILAGGIALAIALATISIQAIKAATANPVESLRYE